MIYTPFEYITTSDAAREALSLFDGETLVGLDTETYWNSDFGRSAVSLVQIAARNGPTLVLDTINIDFNVIRPLVESEHVVMAAHNARFDDGMLKSEGLDPAGFVDTLRMSRLALKLPSHSLASVVDHLFGIKLDKSYQRSNWARRPLTQSQLEYAALDARVTFMLYERLQEVLLEKGILEPGMRAAALKSSATSGGSRRRIEFVPERELNPNERELLLSLKKWRLERSLKSRRPAYMICTDKTLEQLVIRRPVSLQEMESVHGMGASRIVDFGIELLGILAAQDDSETENVDVQL